MKEKNTLDQDIPKLYRMREIADLTDVPKSTLRYYYDIGLIHESDQTDSGILLFSYGMIERIHLIKRLQNENKSIKEIKKYLEVGL